MRFALVQLDLGVRLAGVDKALVGQARAARETGTPMDVVAVNESGAGDVEGVRYLRHAAIPPRLQRASRLFRWRLLASAKELADYDVVFVRYPSAVDLDPLAAVRKTRGRIATVHHAKYIDEILAGGRTATAWGRATLERVQGPRVMRAVDGIVGVTHELRDYERARAGWSVPGTTIANGIDVQRVEPTGFAPYDGSVLRLVFVASSWAPWHGTDRLLSSLRAHRGKQRVHLDLVGAGSGAEPGTEERFGEVTVRHHGALYGDAFDQVLRGANVAVSTLAFHRTGLREGAVLKTRDYLARGIPVVLGYEDVDVPADLPFVMQVPNDDGLLSVDALTAFAERVTRAPDTSRMIRDHAERALDWRVKVRLFDAFARRLLDAPAKR
jgi:hypothetical protein